MLWESGETNGLPLIKFNKMDMRELLESALSKVHEAHLQRIDWEILEKPYDETIDKLESIEPQIVKDNAIEKRLASMEETVWKKTGGKKKDSKAKEGKDGKPARVPCKICGKMHKGECWEKVGKPDNKNNSGG